MFENQLERAQLLIEQNRFRQAKSIIGEALAQDPNSVEALTLMAICQRQLEGILPAVETLKSALEFDAEDYFIWELIARYLVDLNDAKRVEETQQAIDNWSRFSRRSSEWYYTAVRFAESQKKSEEAARLVNEGLATYPRSAYLIYLKGLLHISKKELTEASQMADLMGELAPDNTDYWYLRGCVLEAKGQKEKAKKAFVESLRINPENPYALQALRRVIVRKNRLLFHLFHDFYFPVLKWVLIAGGIGILWSIVLPDGGFSTGLLIISLILIRWVALRFNFGYIKWSASLFEEAARTINPRVQILGKVAIATFFIWLGWWSLVGFGVRPILWVLFSGALFFELVYNFCFYTSFLPHRITSPPRWIHIAFLLVIFALGMYFQHWWLLVLFYVFVFVNALIIGNAMLEREENETFVEEDEKEIYDRTSTGVLLEKGFTQLEAGQNARAKRFFVAVLERDATNETAKKGLMKAMMEDDFELLDMISFPIWKPKFTFWNVVRALIIISNIYLFAPLMGVFLIFAWYLSSMLTGFFVFDKGYRFILPKHKKHQAYFFFACNALIAFSFLGGYLFNMPNLYPYGWLWVSCLFAGLAFFEATSFYGRFSVALVGGFFFLLGILIYPSLVKEDIPGVIAVLFFVVIFGILFSFQVIGGKRKNFEVPKEEI